MLEKELRANWDNVFYPEPEPEVETFGEEVQAVDEPVLLAAGPSGTMTDAGPGIGAGRPVDTIKAIDPTMRQQLADFLQAGFERLGASRNTARKNAQTLVGGGSSNLPIGMGLADIVPFLGTALQTEEAAIAGGEAVEAVKRGDLGEAGVQAGMAAIGMIPGAVGTVKGVRAASKGAKALAPKAGEMIENYLTKTGAILKVAPDAPAIEVPVAGDITKPAFKRWFGASKVADDQGQPIVVYHQTSKAAEPVIMREGFRADKPMARRNDEQVPDGLFFKPTDTDIGVGTSNKADRTQIPVYLSLKNPLVVKDRSQITELINDPEYTRLAKIYDDLDKSLAAEFDAKWNDKEFMKNDAAWDAFSEQWQKRVDTEQPAAAAVARQRLTQVLKERGYDGMIIEKDAGSANRSTKTYIALEPTQVKSIFNKGTWNPNDPRILQGAGGVTATGAATQDKEQK
jgi:hypothetical protein